MRDDSLLSGVAWAAVGLVLGLVLWPRVERWAHRLHRRNGERFWVAVALGWGVNCGPLGLSALGAVYPLFGIPTALGNAFFGLLVGPVLGALSGLLIVGSLLGIVRSVKWVRSCLAGRPITASELLRVFRNDATRARDRYRCRTIRFTAVLMRPPWRSSVCFDDGGPNVLVYFSTGNPVEWLVCTAPRGAGLGELREGNRYLVTGRVYHLEGEATLFLHKCSLRKLRDASETGDRASSASRA